ncbi:MAG: hypothetical protein R2827_11025 [Bdellovibrionales bacterium]
MEPMLLDDLKKLSEKTFECELIQQMDWCLTLEDMTTLLIPIHFRNPYSLKQDAQNDFKTACNQAYYAFESYLKTQKLKKPAMRSTLVPLSRALCGMAPWITNTLVLTTETLSFKRTHRFCKRS